MNKHDDLLMDPVAEIDTVVCLFLYPLVKCRDLLQSQT